MELIKGLAGLIILWGGIAGGISGALILIDGLAK